MRVTPAIVAKRKGGPVSNHGPRDNRTELILAKWYRLPGDCLTCRASGERADIKRVARIKRIIAHILERRAVKTVAAGLRNHVHHAAHGAAKLCFGIVAHDLKLLNQVDIWDHDIGRPPDVGIDNAIEEIELRTILLAME